MATNALPGEIPPGARRTTAADADAGTIILWLLGLLLRFLASLRLTVVLFAMAIFIIFAGTFAQWQKDIWQVVDDYFRTPIAWIDFQIFFPPSFFPSQPQIPDWMVFLLSRRLVDRHADGRQPAGRARNSLQAAGPRHALGYRPGRHGCGHAGHLGHDRRGQQQGRRPRGELDQLAGAVDDVQSRAGRLVAGLRGVAVPARRTARSSSGRSRSSACCWAGWSPGWSSRAMPRGSMIRACESSGN